MLIMSDYFKSFVTYTMELGYQLYGKMTPKYHMVFCQTVFLLHLNYKVTMVMLYGCLRSVATFLNERMNKLPKQIALNQVDPYIHLAIKVWNTYFTEFVQVYLIY